MGQAGYRELACRTHFAITQRKERTELRGEEGDVLDDGQTHAPVLVLRKLLYRRQQRLRQQVYADHLVHLHGEGQKKVFGAETTAHYPMLFPIASTAG